MKKILISLLLCSFPMITVAQTDIQEVEKKAGLVQKLNVPTKTVLGLGAVLSTISTFFYGSKTYTAIQDKKWVEETYFPWLKSVIQRPVPNEIIKSHNSGYTLRALDRSVVSRCCPKLVELCFFDATNKKYCITADSNQMYTTQEEHLNKELPYNHVAQKYGLYRIDGIRIFRHMDYLVHPEDKNRPDSQQLFDVMLRPQLKKVVPSAAALVGCITGLIAFHTYYKKAVKKETEAGN